MAWHCMVHFLAPQRVVSPGFFRRDRSFVVPEVQTPCTVHAEDPFEFNPNRATRLRARRARKKKELRHGDMAWLGGLQPCV